MWVGSLGWEDSSGGRHSNPLQCFCWENPMDRGVWWGTVHRVAKSWTGLRWLSSTCTHARCFHITVINFLVHKMGFPGGSDSKASACNVGDLGLIPGLGRSHVEGNGNPFQYSCLENYMDRGAWRATVYGIPKSQAKLSDLTHPHTYVWKNYPNRVGKYIHYFSKLPLCVCEFGENTSCWGMVFSKRH